jgi:uncharacterized protein
MATPLMPKSTAVWLVENTTLSFEQIADFCGMHSLEVQGIADGEVAVGILGQDPVLSGELVRDEITKAEGDSNYRMQLSEKAMKHLAISKKKGKAGRYTPIARRQDKPEAIAFLLKYHPYLPDSQIVKLIGTTKKTIDAVRDRSHWNTNNIKAKDPVLLGLCLQTSLDVMTQKYRPADAVIVPVEDDNAA